MADMSETYVVHTATVVCTHGMRASCAVLDNTHGVYLRQQPQMTVKDSSGKKNLVCFGGCYSMKNPDTKAEAERIQREVDEECPDTFLDKVLNWFIGDDEELETQEAQEGVPRVVGRCTPKIPPEDVWDNGKETVKTKGMTPLLVGAKLHCIYGGEIEIVDSGQIPGEG